MDFKNNKRTFLVFGIGFFVLVVFMLIFNNNVNNKLEGAEIENISLTANQQQASINGFIESHATNLVSMSKTLYISSWIQSLLLIMIIFFFIFLSSILYFKCKAVKDIENVAFYDDLTGLPNLINFREQVKVMLKDHLDMRFTIQKMDIKNFKNPLNNGYNFKISNFRVKIL